MSWAYTFLYVVGGYLALGALVGLVFLVYALPRVDPAGKGSSILFRLLVFPGSPDVYQAALAEGLIETLAEAGALVTPVTLSITDDDAAPTNILVLEWTGGSAPAFMERLAEQGVKASYLGGTKVRMVTHAGISPADVDYAVETTARVAKEALAVAG